MGTKGRTPNPIAAVIAMPIHHSTAAANTYVIIAMALDSVRRLVTAQLFGRQCQTIKRGKASSLYYFSRVLLALSYMVNNIPQIIPIAITQIQTGTAII
jgi:hypothetical protein